MPGCAIHFQMALRVLDRWRNEPELAPFSLTDPATRNAFLVGCNAPDMGYFPGGDPLLTDFSHYIRSADLVRTLVHTAKSSSELAFAWGWATHILGDALMHPLVNEAAGELLTGTRQIRSYADDPVAHVRVEMGADAYFHFLHAQEGTLATHPIFDRRSIGYLCKAYGQVYGVRMDPGKMLVSHRAVVRYTPWLLMVDRINGGTFLNRSPGLTAMMFNWTLFPLARLLTGLTREKGFAYALTHTVKPTDWFITAIENLLGQFAERFQLLVATNLEDLPQFNLDLGTVEGTPPTYPLAQKAVADLEALQNQAR